MLFNIFVLSIVVAVATDAACSSPNATGSTFTATSGTLTSDIDKEGSAVTYASEESCAWTIVCPAGNVSFTLMGSTYNSSDVISVSETDTGTTRSYFGAFGVVNVLSNSHTITASFSTDSDATTVGSGWGLSWTCTTSMQICDGPSASSSSTGNGTTYLQAESGTILSDADGVGSNATYSLGQSCSYHVQCPPSSYGYLALFTEVNIDIRHSLSVTDGVTGASLTAEIPEGSQTQLYSLTDIVIAFDSQSTVSRSGGRGWTLHWRCATRKCSAANAGTILSGGTSVATPTPVSIKSGYGELGSDGGLTFGQGEQCSWEIDCPTGSKYLYMDYAANLGSAGTLTMELPAQGYEKILSLTGSAASSTSVSLGDGLRPTAVKVQFLSSNTTSGPSTNGGFQLTARCAASRCSSPNISDAFAYTALSGTLLSDSDGVGVQSTYTDEENCRWDVKCPAGYHFAVTRFMDWMPDPSFLKIKGSNQDSNYSFPRSNGQWYYGQSRVTSRRRATTESGGWKLVFRQTVPFYYSNANNWAQAKRHNAEDPTSDNFSILDELEEMRDADKKLTLKLVYPGGVAGRNVWRQTSNPVTASSRGVTGYEAIDISWKSQHWGGLEFAKRSETFLDGSEDHGNWYYAIASTQAWNKGIPGPSSAMNVVELYATTDATTATTAAGNGGISMNSDLNYQTRMNYPDSAIFTGSDSVSIYFETSVLPSTNQYNNKSGFHLSYACLEQPCLAPPTSAAANASRGLIEFGSSSDDGSLTAELAPGSECLWNITCPYSDNYPVLYPVSPTGGETKALMRATNHTEDELSYTVETQNVTIGNTTQTVRVVNISNQRSLFSSSTSSTSSSATESATESGGWKLVFRQTVPFYYSYANNWAQAKRHNAGDPTSDNFSILDELEEMRDADKKLTLKLVYPGGFTGQNVWRQTSNPVTASSRGVTGYEAIDISWESQRWGGLEFAKRSETFLDGAEDHGSWYYAIASTQAWNKGIPGPSSSTAMNVVELYAATDATTATTAAGILSHQSISRSVSRSGAYYMCDRSGYGRNYYRNNSYRVALCYSPTASTTNPRLADEYVISDSAIHHMLTDPDGGPSRYKFSQVYCRWTARCADPAKVLMVEMMHQSDKTSTSLGGERWRINSGDNSSVTHYRNSFATLVSTNQDSKSYYSALGGKPLSFDASYSSVGKGLSAKAWCESPTSSGKSSAAMCYHGNGTIFTPGTTGSTILSDSDGYLPRYLPTLGQRCSYRVQCGSAQHIYLTVEGSATGQFFFSSAETGNNIGPNWPTTRWVYNGYDYARNYSSSSYRRYFTTKNVTLTESDIWIRWEGDLRGASLSGKGLDQGKSRFERGWTMSVKCIPMAEKSVTPILPQQSTCTQIRGVPTHYSLTQRAQRWKFESKCDISFDCKGVTGAHTMIISVEGLGHYYQGSSVFNALWETKPHMRLVSRMNNSRELSEKQFTHRNSWVEMLDTVDNTNTAILDMFSSGVYVQEINVFCISTHDEVPTSRVLQQQGQIDGATGGADPAVSGRTVLRKIAANRNGVDYGLPYLWLQSRGYTFFSDWELYSTYPTFRGMYRRGIDEWTVLRCNSPAQRIAVIGVFGRVDPGTPGDYLMLYNGENGDRLRFTNNGRYQSFAKLASLTGSSVLVHFRSSATGGDGMVNNGFTIQVRCGYYELNDIVDAYGGAAHPSSSFSFLIAALVSIVMAVW